MATPQPNAPPLHQLQPSAHYNFNDANDVYSITQLSIADTSDSSPTTSKHVTFSCQIHTNLSGNQLFPLGPLTSTNYKQKNSWPNLLNYLKSQQIVNNIIIFKDKKCEQNLLNDTQQFPLKEKQLNKFPVKNKSANSTKYLLPANNDTTRKHVTYKKSIYPRKRKSLPNSNKALKGRPRNHLQLKRFKKYHIVIESKQLMRIKSVLKYMQTKKNKNWKKLYYLRIFHLKANKQICVANSPRGRQFPLKILKTVAKFPVVNKPQNETNKKLTNLKQTLEINHSYKNLNNYEDDRSHLISIREFPCQVLISRGIMEFPIINNVFIKEHSLSNDLSNCLTAHISKNANTKNSLPSCSMAQSVQNVNKIIDNEHVSQVQDAQVEAMENLRSCTMIENSQQQTPPQNQADDVDDNDHKTIHKLADSNSINNKSRSSEVGYYAEKIEYLQDAIVSLFEKIQNSLITNHKNDRGRDTNATKHDVHGIAANVRFALTPPMSVTSVQNAESIINDNKEVPYQKFDFGDLCVGVGQPVVECSDVRDTLTEAVDCGNTKVQSTGSFLVKSEEPLSPCTLSPLPPTNVTDNTSLEYKLNKGELLLPNNIQFEENLKSNVGQIRVLENETSDTNSQAFQNNLTKATLTDITVTRLNKNEPEKISEIKTNKTTEHKNNSLVINSNSDEMKFEMHKIKGVLPNSVSERAPTKHNLNSANNNSTTNNNWLPSATNSARNYNDSPYTSTPRSQIKHENLNLAAGRRASLNPPLHPDSGKIRPTDLTDISSKRASLNLINSSILPSNTEQTLQRRRPSLGSLRGTQSTSQLSVDLPRYTPLPTTKPADKTISNNRAASIDSSLSDVLPERTRLRRQRRLRAQDSLEEPGDAIERLNRIRARISASLSEVKGVLKQYSTEGEAENGNENQISSTLSTVKETYEDDQKAGARVFKEFSEDHKREGPIVSKKTNDSGKKEAPVVFKETNQDDKREGPVVFKKLNEDDKKEVSVVSKETKEDDKKEGPVVSKETNEADRKQGSVVSKETNEEDKKEGPVVFRFVKKVRRRSIFTENDEKQQQESIVSKDISQMESLQDNQHKSTNETDHCKEEGTKGLASAKNEIVIDESKGENFEMNKDNKAALMETNEMKLKSKFYLLKEEAQKSAESKDQTDHCKLQSDIHLLKETSGKVLNEVSKEKLEEKPDEAKEDSKTRTKPVQKEAQELDEHHAKQTTKEDEEYIKSESGFKKELELKGAIPKLTISPEQAKSENDSSGIHKKLKKKIILKPKDTIRRASLAAVEASKIEPAVKLALPNNIERRPSDSEAVVRKKTLTAKLNTSGAIEEVTPKPKIVKVKKFTQKSINNSNNSTHLATKQQEADFTLATANVQSDEHYKSLNKDNNNQSIVSDKKQDVLVPKFEDLEKQQQQQIKNEITREANSWLPTQSVIDEAASLNAKTIEISKLTPRQQQHQNQQEQNQKATIKSTATKFISNDLQAKGDMLKNVTTVRSSTTASKANGQKTRENVVQPTGYHDLLQTEISLSKPSTTNALNSSELANKVESVVTKVSSSHDNYQTATKEQPKKQAATQNQQVLKTTDAAIIKNDINNNSSKHEDLKATATLIKEPCKESTTAAAHVEVEQQQHQQRRGDEQTPTNDTKTVSSPHNSISCTSDIAHQATTKSALLSTSTTATGDEQTAEEVSSATQQNKMPERQLAPAPVQTADIIPQPEHHKKKIIIKKIIRQTTTDKSKKPESQEAKSLPETQPQINKPTANQTHLLPPPFKDIQNVASTETVLTEPIQFPVEAEPQLSPEDVPEEFSESTEISESSTSLGSEEVPPSPDTPKKERIVKKKVIIKRQKRRLSIGESFFHTGGSNEQPQNAEIETLEKAIAFVSDDEAEDTNAKAQDEPSEQEPEEAQKPLRSCILRKEYNIGDEVLYAERFKKTQIKWRRGRIKERITSISYLLDIDGKDVSSHINYLKKFTNRKVSFGGKEYLEIDYEQLAEEEEKAEKLKKRSYSIWNMV